jgi:hypothetical protein
LSPIEMMNDGWTQSVTDWRTLSFGAPMTRQEIATKLIVGAELQQKIIITVKSPPCKVEQVSF